MDGAKIMDTKTADKVIVNEWNNTQKYWMSLNMIGGTIEIEEGVNRPTADKAGSNNCIFHSFTIILI